MDDLSLSLTDINDFLRNALAVDRYPTPEQGGIYCASDRPIRRLGLALEPFYELPQWLETEAIDALWLHRPWQLRPDTLPPDVGVLHHHLPFDKMLTMGYNEPLASQLGAVGGLEPLLTKPAAVDPGPASTPQPIGMLLTVADREFDTWLSQVRILFGGYDRAEVGSQGAITRLAVVGAMTDALVREAAGRGAHLYLTGQYRKPAQEAVDDTGMAVIAIGHRRSEEWGLRALATLLQAHWPALTVVLGG